MTRDRESTEGARPARRVTADDVAELAKVSRSAVSRTFTPGGSVSTATRAAVLKAAEGLGYRPNLLARSLITKRASLIAVVMANLNSPFFSEFVARLNVQLRSRGFRMLLLVVPQDGDPDDAMREALDYSVDGAILVSAKPSRAVIHEFAKAHIPIVAMNSGNVGPEAALVWTDGLSVGMSVAELMIAEGRKQPAAIIGAGRARTREFEVFAEWMERSGAQPCLWYEVPLDYDAALDLGEVLFGSDAPRPDAIFAATDLVAVGILDAAKLRYGISIPDDLSIVGIGDTLPARWQSQQLSTVRIPIGALVDTAISTLMARIDGSEESPPKIWLECDLVERGTTRARQAPR